MTDQLLLLSSSDDEDPNLQESFEGIAGIDDAITQGSEMNPLSVLSSTLPSPAPPSSGSQPTISPRPNLHQGASQQAASINRARSSASQPVINISLPDSDETDDDSMLQPPSPPPSGSISSRPFATAQRPPTKDLISETFLSGHQLAILDPVLVQQLESRNPTSANGGVSTKVQNLLQDRKALCAMLPYLTG